MSNKYGGYLASPDIQVSTANQQLIPPSPSNWTSDYKLLKLSFDNIEDCTVIVNNVTEIRLKAGQGFEMGYDDPPVHSFIIKEDGVQYNFIAAY